MRESWNELLSREKRGPDPTYPRTLGMRLPITPYKVTGSDEGYSENKMSASLS